MTRFILALIVSLGVLIPTASIAQQTNTEQTVQVKKKPVKKYKRKKVKKKAVIVKEERNAFIRCEDRDCSPKPVQQPTIVSHSTGDQTAAEFFREDKIRQQLLESPLKLTRDEKRQQVARGCSWFTCSQDNKVVMEAKAWEGKTAKKDRKELRNLFADGNMPPVDPVRTPWCAAFANAILSRSGYETTKSLMARSFLAWGIGTKDPREGDIVVLKRGRDGVSGHVGFFQGYEVVDGVTYVKVLGGNTDHAVQVGYYPVNKVLGYRTAVA
jgi:uncharacterized protein (TIGR02594 family)